MNYSARGVAASDRPNAHAVAYAREREVLKLVLDGKLSRTIADELHISEKTVEYHRARIRAKLGVRSLAELFRTCLAATQGQEK